MAWQDTIYIYISSLNTSSDSQDMIILHSTAQIHIIAWYVWFGKIPCIYIYLSSLNISSDSQDMIILHSTAHVHITAWYAWSGKIPCIYIQPQHFILFSRHDHPAFYRTHPYNCMACTVWQDTMYIYIQPQHFM